MSGDVSFAVLGPLEVRVGGARLRLGGPIPARVLATLLLEPGRMVPVSRLVAAAWDGEPPTTAAHQVRKAVADLRRRIPDGASLIVTEGPGYRVDLEPDRLDLTLFSLRLGRARAALDAARPAEAADHLRSALALWRGPVLHADCGPVIAAASAVLEERRLTAVEQLVELRLGLGESGEIVGDLRELIAEHPLRETLRGHLMLALYRSGRQAEALAEFGRVRELLVEDLGIDPGPRLTRLYEAILRDSPELAAPEPPDARAPAGARPPAPTAPAPAASPSPPPPLPLHLPLFPATAARAGAPCTLPPDLPDFTGRERELRRLLARPELPGAAARVLGIDGMGGSGKTALALHAAHRLAADYPDGQLYADLRGFSPGESPRRPGTVIGSLLRVLGTPGERVPDDLDGRTALWRATLAERRVLLLLDNAADAAQVRPLLPASSGCLVLVTSRSRLTGLDGADWIGIGMMPPPDSLALLDRVVGAQRVRSEPAAAAELGALCGHLPLALRIAAARLRSRPRWTLSHLVDRLGDETRRIDELSSGDQSVKATLQLSYEAMGSAHRDALRLIGLHPGREIGIHSAAALLGTGLRAAEEVLEHLLDTNLVGQGEIGRYVLHDLVRSFTHGLHGGRTRQEELAAFERVLDHYLAAADEACRILFPGRNPLARGGRGHGAGPAALPAFADAAAAESWFEQEQGALLNAVERAEQLGFTRHAAQLARNLVFHLNSRSQLEEFQRVADVSVAAARRLADPRLLRVSLSNQAVARCKLGRFQDGTAAAAEALDLATGLADRGGEAVCLTLLGLLQSFLGDLDGARRHLERGAVLHRELADARQEAYTLCNLSSVYTWTGRHREAAEAAGRAVLLSRRAGSGAEEISALNDLAIAQLALGEEREALATVERAMELADDCRMPENLALALALAAEVFQRTGAGARAAAYAERSLHLIRSKGTAMRQAAVENVLGRVHFLRGDPERARELHESAYRHAEAITYRIEAARALDGMALALEALGRPDSARSHRSRATAVRETLGRPTPSPATSSPAGV
ncbi:BTAD domain-containing putative transcriptional regulator [Streptomyces sp. NPDC046866]|uniref:AfsR/SARP family transcriptional regulator n=1 Tax=Streptomyces sp. NPDC046866 TaxID=3154921 RepID=UPI003456ED17